MDDNIKTLVLLKYKIPCNYDEYIDFVESCPEIGEIIARKGVRFYKENTLADIRSYNRWKIVQDLIVESLCEYESKHG